MIQGEFIRMEPTAQKLDVDESHHAGIYDFYQIYVKDGVGNQVFMSQNDPESQAEFQL